jgi:hypothetical protein
MKNLLTIIYSFLLLSVCAISSFGTVIEPLDFDTIVEQSGVVIEGTVVDLQTFSTGSDIRDELPKQHVAPKAPPETVPEDSKEETASTDLDDADWSAPQGLEVEGGKMLFTEVTMAVEKNIVGDVGSSVTFHIAGGEDDNVKAVVYGMPDFEINKRYIVFLRSDFKNSAVPITGVNQGFFEVVKDEATGEDILLNANGNIVVSVENNRVVVKQNPQRTARITLQMGPAPVPAPGSDVQVEVSPEAARYWLSKEPPMPVNDFIDAVERAKETNR